MPANIGGATTPKNATNRSRPWLARYPRNHVTKTKMLITIWIRPDTTFNPTKKSVKLAIRKKASPVAAEIAIHSRLLRMKRTSFTTSNYFRLCNATLLPSVSRKCAINPFCPMDVLGSKIFPPAFSTFERTLLRSSPPFR